MEIPIQDAYLNGGVGGNRPSAKEKRRKKERKAKRVAKSANAEDAEDDGEDGEDGEGNTGRGGGSAQAADTTEAKQKKGKKVNPDEQVLAKGVRALDIKVGDGEEVVEGRRVRVAYVGRLETPHGAVFDRSAKGDWFPFRLGRKQKKRSFLAAISQPLTRHASARQPTMRACVRACVHG